jgi:pimeloyl-ACP methyl ester carboxylesterase
VYRARVSDIGEASYAEAFARVVGAARRKELYVASETPPLRRSDIVNGRKLHFLDWEGSEQPPMLLLHGALLQAHVWDFFCLDMRQHFWIHALDLPGHGDSQWAADGDYSRSRVAADVLSFIKQRDFPSVVLVGHSFGGAVASLVAAAIPERVRALVMVDSTLLPTGRPSVRTRMAGGPQSFGSFDEFVAHAARFSRRGDTARLVDSLRWNARQMEDGRCTWKYDPELRATPLGPADFSDVWSALRAYHGPLLFVRAGEHSHLTDEAVQRLRELPNLSLVPVPHAAHNVMSDNPAAFRNEVASFLALHE